MKNKLGKILFTLFASISLMSCGGAKDGGDGNGSEPKLEVSTSTLTSNAQGGDMTLNLSASSDYVVVIPDADKKWIGVNSKSKTQLVLTVAQNITVNPRNSSIILRLISENKSVIITVIQTGIPDDPTRNISAVSPTGAIVGTGGTIDVDVTANADYEAIIPTSAQSWLSVENQDGASITFGAIVNAFDVTRSAVVTLRLVSYPSKSCTVTITQEKGVAGSDAYTLQSSMKADVSIAPGTSDYKPIDTYMKKYGWDYSENPSISSADHPNGVHCEVVFDSFLNEYVFKLNNHVEAHLDGDRGTPVGGDRQRNELKSQTSAAWYKLNGNYGDWQRLEWKMKIPSGFRPSTAFTHIHQLKGQEGNNIGAPVITLSLRADASGSNKRVQIIHTVDGPNGGFGSLGTVKEVPMSDFEDEWVQIVEEAHFLADGYYRMTITRIRDGQVLLEYEKTSGINMVRSGATNIRNKFGIYRSFGSTMANASSRPTNGIKDESIFFNDFKAYKKSQNPSPKPAP